MATNSIVLKGTTYNGVSSIELPTSSNGTALFTDVSDTTAVASDVASGKYFYTALGALTEGTASGGGGGGLEYESGTWTPSEDVEKDTISFINTHSVAPYYFMIADTTGTYDSTTNSVYYVAYDNFHQAFGVPQDISNGTYIYGHVYRRWKNSATGSTGGTITLNTPYTDSSASLNSSSRFWATETSIRAYSANGQYFRAGRTYKWIAVWAPTS